MLLCVYLGLTKILNMDDIVPLLPLVIDIKTEIKKYLIPSPPIYGYGIVREAQ